MARTLEFDPDRALSRAMDYFWLHGYEASHIRDLAEYMGISKSSFYNTYGDKHRVYIVALSKYLEQEYLLLERLLEPNPPPDQLLPTLFSEVSERFSGRAQQRGSFMVNAAVERAPHDPEARSVVAEHFERFADLLSGYFALQQQVGAIVSQHDPKILAHSLISTLYSLGVLARLDLGLDARENVVRAAMTLYV
jgi:TetR/AcrR family transcriptional repressor of nem operon